jgi:hypothetical protein
MYSALHEDRADHPLLRGLPGDDVPAKEEDDARGALPAIEVAGHVCVAVADQSSLSSFMLGVEQPVRACAGYVAQHLLDSILVILVR